MEVLDVDQWTATGNIRQIKWDDLKRQGIDAVSGGDSEAAKRIFGGAFWFRDVGEKATPSIGHAWFIKGADGFPTIYLTNYDSSD